MNTKEHLEAYIHKIAMELKELKTINWPASRAKLNKRKISLENLLKLTINELKLVQTNKQIIN